MCTLSTSKSLCTSTHGTAQIVIEDTNDLDLSALYFLAFIPKQHPLSNIQLEDIQLLDEQVKRMRKQWVLKV